jgi:hypothetical protein
MADLKLYSGRTVIVDDDDFDFVSQWQWHESMSQEYGYFLVYKFLKKRQRVLELTETPSPRVTYLHRELLARALAARGLCSLAGTVVKHRNGKATDFRKANLFVKVNGTGRFQSSHRAHYKVNGVKAKVKGGPYQSILTIGRHSILLGEFSTVGEAAEAYDQELWRRWGSFAQFNYPGNFPQEF